jgi:hypothetical protein
MHILSDRPNLDPKTWISLQSSPLLWPNNISLALILTRARSYISPAMPFHNPRLVSHTLTLLTSRRPQRHPINKLGPRWPGRARITMKS